MLNSVLQVLKAQKETSVKHKTSQLKSVQVGLNHHKEDYDNSATQLESRLKQIELWNQSCVYKAQSFEERAERRQAEISGLKEALEILSADAEEPAALLLQKKRGFMQKKLVA